MVAYQHELADGIFARRASCAKQAQQLRFQYLRSLIYQRHVEALQAEQVALGRECGHRPYKHPALHDALLHGATIGAIFQHIFNQMRTISLLASQFAAETYVVDGRIDGRQGLADFIDRSVRV